jgi:CRISPR/Cas system endoribonuclease Cas6 (RAMP superfamily)
VTRPLPELGGRSLSSAWAAGDRETVERWLDEQYAATEAIVETHRTDPEYMARIRALQRDRRTRQARSA